MLETSCLKNHKLILKKKKLSYFAGLPFHLKQDSWTEVSSLHILWYNLGVLKSIYLLSKLFPPHPSQRVCTERGDGQNQEGKTPVAMCTAFANSFNLLEGEDQRKSGAENDIEDTTQNVQDE